MLESHHARYVSADVLAISASHDRSSPLAGAAESLASEIGSALDQMAAAVDALIAVGDRGDFGALGPEGLIALARELESQQARCIIIESHLYEAGLLEELGKYTCTSSTAHAFAQLLRIRPAEARARARRADHILPTNSFSAGEGSPNLPTLAAAVRAGELSRDQVDIISTAMRRLRTNADLEPADRTTAEQTLVHHAHGMGTNDLHRVAQKIDDVLAPDGRLPRGHLAHARRAINISTERADGTYRIHGFLTRELKARFEAAIGPYSAPHPAEDRTRDTRSYEQRTHDGLNEALQYLLATAGGVPATGGTPATVHLTVNLNDLLTALHANNDPSHDTHDWAAIGTISGGDRITINDLTHLAHEAMLIPTWITDTGGIVAFGRTRRIATENQTHALIARDHGCSFPTCQATPDRCERHHIKPWWNGGTTDLNNLTLMCRHHHRHFEESGWRAHIINGLPWWIPPPWIDPHQRPVLNTRIAIPDHHQIEHATTQSRAALSTTPPATNNDEAEGLDPADELIALLAAHIPNPHERAAFTRTTRLLDDYTNAAYSNADPTLADHTAA
ncbi:HNH endonuclease signature motif containing protein [Cumulibacter soli]|uniref:HNH endonuclease signature motif containing protein n=1 Tax=Cumulibacter soli TaxID=2546344 RepID=UPI0010677B36|nr:HNH endonuclease signature motif containing protein [Cumulibacter soli]